MHGEINHKREESHNDSKYILRLNGCTRLNVSIIMGGYKSVEAKGVTGVCVCASTLVFA